MSAPEISGAVVTAFVVGVLLGRRLRRRARHRRLAVSIRFDELGDDSLAPGDDP